MLSLCEETQFTSTCILYCLVSICYVSWSFGISNFIFSLAKFYIVRTTVAPLINTKSLGALVRSMENSGIPVQYYIKISGYIILQRVVRMMASSPTLTHMLSLFHCWHAVSFFVTSHRVVSLCEVPPTLSTKWSVRTDLDLHKMPFIHGLFYFHVCSSKQQIELFAPFSLIILYIITYYKIII